MGFAPGPFLFGLRPLGATGAETELERGGAERGGGGRRGGLRARAMTGQADGAGMGADPASGRPPSAVAQLLSALFYGTCSFLIVLVNKTLLTTYR